LDDSGQRFLSAGGTLREGSSSDLLEFFKSVSAILAAILVCRHAPSQILILLLISRFQCKKNVVEMQFEQFPLVEEYCEKLNYETLRHRIDLFSAPAFGVSCEIGGQEFHHGRWTVLFFLLHIEGLSGEA
jgi:hypothetical protein